MEGVVLAIGLLSAAFAAPAAGVAAYDSSPERTPDLTPPTALIMGYPDSYLLDDGEGDNSFGSPSGHIGWINQFVIIPGYEVITAISVAWGQMLPGVYVKAYVWSDPDQDGDPIDAKVLSSAGVYSANVNSDDFTDIPIPPVYIGPAETSFFVGLIALDLAGQFPARLDQSRPRLRSWYVSDLITIDAENLAAAALVRPMHSFGAAFAGNWMVRAWAFPSPGGAAVVGLSLFWLTPRRRQSAVALPKHAGQVF